MATNKLNIAFIWHMHQPFYKNLITDEYVMPWVRLHAIKDYYDMVAILEPFPKIHQTFNLVPSLIEQILDYVNNNAQDNILKLTSKPASELNSDEKIDILTKFFMANWETMIRIYPRYKSLLEKRGESITIEKLQIIKNSLTTQDFLDLQVWYNLAWFDPIFKKNDPELIRLIGKNEKYTENEKISLLKKQIEIMGKILPVYKEFMDKGQIEVSVSPYYHPILPLLINTQIAKVASPYMTLPEEKFEHPEDARWHIEKAIQCYKDIFDRAPSGMWPSEGSVCEDLIPMLSENGIKWIATDEQILEKSLNYRLRYSSEYPAQSALYKAYTAEKNNHSVNIVFRDIKLSDKIGFVYSRWNANDAVNDFLNSLHKIRNSLPDNPENYIVNVILDGENAWEYYPDDGREFLIKLYERLSEDENFQCVTVSEYLQKKTNNEKLNNLFPGSWINSNFDIWIGHPEDNIAWNYLISARKKLIEFQNIHENEKEILEKAWKEIYISEGSDWCWWYGDEFSSENDAEFDNLFRQHVMNVYKLIGAEIPSYLYLPITKKIKLEKNIIEPHDFISPIIDGKISHYYEWAKAGLYDIQNIGSGAMHRADTIIQKIYFGFNQDNIYLRIDPRKELKKEVWENIIIDIYILNPKRFKIDIEISLCNHFINAILFKEKKQEFWEKVSEIKDIAFQEIIEMQIPKQLIEFDSVGKFDFMVIVFRNNLELEHWPIRGPIDFNVTMCDFENVMWQL